MIKILFDLVMFVFNLIVTIIPDFSSIFSEIPEFMGTIIDVLSLSGFIIPWGSVFICFGLLITVWNYKFIMSVVNFILKLIPGVG